MDILRTENIIFIFRNIYPFGMSFAEGTYPDKQPYKYNGKELDTENGLNLYDSNARFYDPVILRTPTPDFHSENYYPWSPYAWVGNNPMRITDPTGMDWYEDEDGNAMWRRSQDEEYTDDDGRVWKNIGTEYLHVRGNRATLFSQGTNDEGELTLQTSSYNLSDEESTSSLVSTMGDIVSKGSAIAGAVGEGVEGSSATFRLTNSKGFFDFKFYGNGWKGNQSVTPIAMSNLGKIANKVGTYAGLVSVGFSSVQLLQSTTLEGRSEHGLDVFMGGIGLVPPGTVVSLFWSFGGKTLHYQWRDKVLQPQIIMGISGYPSVQPFK